MDFKLNYLNNGVYETSAKSENVDFLKQVAQIVFLSLKNYEEIFKEFYFPLRRKHTNDEIKIRSLQKIESKEITGYTNTVLSMKYRDYSNGADVIKRTEKVGDLEIFLLSPKETISVKDPEKKLFADTGFPVKKKNRFEILLPFGMLKQDGKFYSNIVSLNQTFEEDEDPRCIDVGVNHTMAESYLKNDDYGIGNKRNFYPKPSLILTRGVMPSGKKWGETSTLSNSWVNAMQLFGLISVDVNKKSSQKFINYVTEKIRLPWQDFEKRRSEDFTYHSESSIC